MEYTEESLALLDTAYILASEQSYIALFDTMLNACVKFTNADGGTLYIVDEESKRLVHLLDMNLTLDQSQQSSYEADMLPAEDAETNLFTYIYRHSIIRNIPDIYEEKDFEIRAIREFDARNQYRTRSVLLSPIAIEKHDVLGVLMLYNCKDGDGNVVPFNSACETAVKSLTTQLASNLTNMMLLQKQEDLLDSFVECMTAAIDEKTPYNATHTRKVAQYCEEICEYINTLHTKGELDDSWVISENDKEQLHMAAMLHDIGKIITPREILNKASRMSAANFNNLYNKLEKIRLMLKIHMLEGYFDPADWAVEDRKIAEFLNDLLRMNTGEFLTDADIQKVDEMAQRTYTNPQGDPPIAYLNEEEQKALHIRKGTLTEDERKQVQEHVVYTERILSKIQFTAKYNKVKEIASNHHEYLDGTGYPKGLKAPQLDKLTRILTACDIFDSLTAEDRPYKAPMELPEARKIMESMARSGKLDSKIVELLFDYMEENFKRPLKPLLLSTESKPF